MKRDFGAALALFLALTAGGVAVCRAAETAAFLKISPGARPMAMGEAFTGVADDLNALAWNPAGIGQLRRKEAAFMHAELFMDTRYDFVGYAHPLGDAGRAGALALGVSRLSQGAIEGRDEDRRPTASFGASDTAVQLAFSRRVGGGPLLGASVKFLQSEIAGARASGAAFDLGVLKDVRPAGLPLRLGASVLNLGPGLRYLDETNDLPLTVSVGAGIEVVSGVRIALDYRQRVHSAQSQAGIGTEYALMPAMTLRAGYAAGLHSAASAGDAPTKALGGMGLGFGLRLGRADLDYAFTPAGELGNAQRISLSTRF